MYMRRLKKGNEIGVGICQGRSLNAIHIFSYTKVGKI